MIDELFIYAKENSLFKAVLSQSAKMQGRYHVSSNGAMDLNTNNLDTLVANIAEQKYPMCVCLTPKSEMQQEREVFQFNLLFLDSTYYTSTGAPKQPNNKTGQSTHEVWMDWQDMKNAAVGFITTLDTVTRTRNLASGQRIGMFFNISMDSINVRRLSKFNQDRVSGVSITFIGNLNNGLCVTPDYENNAVANITIPTNINHPEHG